MLTYGRRIPPIELDYRIQVRTLDTTCTNKTALYLMQQVDAKVVRDVCSRYIYDKCPALVGIGEFLYCIQWNLSIWDTFGPWKLSFI